MKAMTAAERAAKHRAHVKKYARLRREYVATREEHQYTRNLLEALRDDPQNTVQPNG